MSDAYVSETVELTEDMWAALIAYETVDRRANVKRYLNTKGQVNEKYDIVDADGLVIGKGLSTNVGDAGSGKASEPARSQHGPK